MVDGGISVDVGHNIEGQHNVDCCVEIAEVMPGTEEQHHGRSHGLETFREMGNRHGDGNK